MLFVIYYSFDLLFSDVDVAFCLGASVSVLVLVRAGVLVLVLVLRVAVLLTTLLSIKTAIVQIQDPVSVLFTAFRLC